ncbi:GNAT family N-acetyltransferase [Hymenobacter sp. BT491]|uniref:GNAT family N-acetyltransferase n=1 Tax=Hymenobacter sp. BT491 TaxID=2766779 RepID=UPI00165378FC|nr:GNAT family N-acetyltransferase [Hymenobacter sp. BT491]MBC6988869.1 GNAT family N-acetyltransferase [Hymenobacter sp. BT491]
MSFAVRRAEVSDISAMHVVRMAVRENQLRTPGLVTEQHYREMLTERGAGWVAESAGRIVGFAVVDAVAQSVWALFVEPDWEQRGVGAALHSALLAWCAERGLPRLTLSTAPGTRAVQFYLAKGWEPKGSTKSGEVLFEMVL